MSRTYRRKNAGFNVPGYGRVTLASMAERFYPEVPSDVGQKRYLAHYHSDAAWMMNTPSWWIRLMMTRPQRAETRQLLHKVKLLIDLEDAPIFPHPKKPHIWYW